MRVGVGLPSGIPGASGGLIVDWARRADEGPFTSLGVIDRYVFDSYEPLTALAAAAAVTRRVRLATMIVIGPLRNTALLAKVAASVDALSDGRLVLGLAVGARQDDYQVAKLDYRQRGRILNEQLASLRKLWESGRLGPKPVRPGGPEILIGGFSDRAIARAARYADGFIHAGGSPQAFDRTADRMRAAWRDASRLGMPQLWGQAYFALGEGAADRGVAYLKDYYAFAGPFADTMAAGLLATPQSVIECLKGCEEAGCSEMVLLPTLAEPSQLDRLAEVVAPL